MFRLSPIQILLLLPVLLLSTVHADDTVAKKAYAVCAGCHGFKGEGNAVVNAPALGAQETWYLERQMRNFAKGIRGGKGDDVHGQTMATMIKTLNSDGDVKLIAAYIHKLPMATPEATFTADAARGKTLYATCAACHGANAEGNKALNSPSLKGMSDFYMLAQLKKFKTGSRGKHPQDTYGQQMAPMAAILADEQAMKDVIAYIGSL